MLLEYIARYYKFLWLALIIIVAFKITLSYSFNGKLRGIYGALYAVFKWYSREEQEMEDNESRKVIMRFHNIITLLIYLAILIVATVAILNRILPH